MTRYRGHYLPVAARRRVLEIYRDRRTNWVPLTDGPLPPQEAMQATVRFFEGWLANAVAFGFPKDVEALTDQVRAADYYLHQMYRKPDAFKARPPRRSDLQLADEAYARMVGAR